MKTYKVVFIPRDENYAIGEPWMLRHHIPQCDRVVYDCRAERDVDKNGMTKEDRNLENFYCSGLHNV